MSPLEVAITAAKRAGTIIRENSGTLQHDQIQFKKKFDYVTKIDRDSEALIVNLIREHFPQHAILAEETGGLEIKSSYQWIIDPLDGTTNFIHGIPVCAISIALTYLSEIILGVVYDPFRDELFYAEKNKGAFLNNRKISVSKENDFTRCLIATGFPFKDKNLLAPYLEVFSTIFNQVSGIRRMGSAALDLAYVACGRVDGFWEFKLSPWDIAAGALLVREAGGKITDATGDAYYLQTGDVIASNTAIYDLIFQAVQQFFKTN